MKRHPENKPKTAICTTVASEINNDARDSDDLQALLATQKAYKDRLQEIETKIENVNGVSFELGRLAKAGADPKKILGLLALAVNEIQWPTKMRKRQEALRSLAGQMRTVANHAERESLNPLSYSDVWKAIFGKLDWSAVREPSNRAPLPLFQAMREYANGVAGQANSFGHVLKTNLPKERRYPQEMLLLYVHKSTGNASRHLVEVTQLLMHAYDTFGIRRKVTIESLTRVWERHVELRVSILNKTTP